MDERSVGGEEVGDREKGWTNIHGGRGEDIGIHNLSVSNCSKAVRKSLESTTLLIKQFCASASGACDARYSQIICSQEVLIFPPVLQTSSKHL